MPFRSIAFVQYHEGPTVSALIDDISAETILKFVEEYAELEHADAPVSADPPFGQTDYVYQVPDRSGPLIVSVNPRYGYASLTRPLVN